MSPTFELTFRPDYWSPTDPLAAILVNVKGQRRREMIADIITGRAAEMAAAVGHGEAIQAALAEVAPALLADELDNPNALSWINPTFMGGEFLPSYIPGEVEIARLTLNSTTMDVYSIRARRRTRCIKYRVVDEYGYPWTWRPKTSRRPLTLGQVVGLIDSLKDGGGASNGPDYLTGWWEFGPAARSVSDLKARTAFITVSSVFYPQLELYYRHYAEEWIERQRRLLSLPMEAS